MKRQVVRSMCAATFALLTSSLELELAHAQAPQGKPVTIRGKISVVEGRSLRVATTSGEVSVRFPDDVRIGGVAAAQLSEITAGNYVGTTAVKQADGNLKALEVHIFPETSRGTGEGHRPWDLQPGSTMTNGNVEQVEQLAVERFKVKCSRLATRGDSKKYLSLLEHLL